MGRTLPPATQLMLELIADLAPLYEALPLNSQLRLDQIFDPLVRYKAAFNNSSNILPLEIFLVLALLEERKKNYQIINEIFTEIDKLRKENNGANSEE